MEEVIHRGDKNKKENELTETVGKEACHSWTNMSKKFN